MEGLDWHLVLSQLIYIYSYNNINSGTLRQPTLSSVQVYVPDIKYRFAFEEQFAISRTVHLIFIYDYFSFDTVHNLAHVINFLMTMTRVIINRKS